MAFWYFLKQSFIERGIKWDGCCRIKGTKDVIVGKVVGTLHSSSSVLFLSIFGGADALLARVIYTLVGVAGIINIGLLLSRNYRPYSNFNSVL